MLASVDTTRLHVFRQVVSCGSFTAAAAALGISQPAVSQHIARLEQEIGTALLDRSGRGLRMTQPGEVLLRHTDGLLNHIREAAKELQALAQPDGGEVRMAAFPSAAASIVPPVIGSFREALPRAKVSLTEADPPQALPRLLAGELDIALAYDYPTLAAAKDPRLHWEVLARDPMAVALPIGHRAADRDEVDLADLAAESWVAPHPCQCLDAFLLACRETGFTPDVVTATNDYLAMLGLVSAGLGLAVVPRIVAKVAVPAGVVLRPLRRNPLLRSVVAVTRETGYQPPATGRMRALLRSIVPTLADPALPLIS